AGLPGGVRVSGERTRHCGPGGESGARAGSSGGRAMATASGPLADASALTDSVVTHVARLVSIGQLPSGRAERTRKSTQRVTAGWSRRPAPIRLIATKLVSGVASRKPPPVGWIAERTRSARRLAMARSARVIGL